jgi:hypothetical protein
VTASTWPASLRLDTTLLAMACCTCTYSRSYCCGSCHIEKDTLEPLAQLSSLQELWIDMTRQNDGSVTQLLSTAVQGAGLRIVLSRDTDQHVKEHLLDMHAALVAQKGEALVPRVEVEAAGNE